MQNGSIKFELISWVMVIILAAGWSSMESMRALIAVANAKPIAVQDNYKDNQIALVELKRNLQKHFLQYGVYLPLEDIVYVETDIENDRRSREAVRQVCGDQSLVVWVPLSFKLPLVGERVIEWCWNPTLAKS